MLTTADVERTVRRVVVRTLGVPARALRARVSLREDLAVDARRIEDVVLAVESRVGVRVAGVLAEVRTYGDLVAATLEGIRSTRERLARESAPIESARVRVSGSAGMRIDRSGPLTPYLLEAIRDDARRAGPGATVSILVGGAVSDAVLEGVARRLEPLARRGVGIRIGRESPLPPAA